MCSIKGDADAMQIFLAVHKYPPVPGDFTHDG